MRKFSFYFRISSKKLEIPCPQFVNSIKFDADFFAELKPANGFGREFGFRLSIKKLLLYDSFKTI